MQHGHYWSNTTLANWIRGTKKPFSETSKGWLTWRREAKDAHPVRYWLAETALDSIQDFFRYPSHIFNNGRYYIKNRFFDKIHYLPTRLEPGRYYDLDQRFLHGCFETLIDFVEVEKAWMKYICDDDSKVKYDTPWRVSQWWTRLWSWRCPQAGLDYLDWEITLGDPTLPEDQRCESQAQAALETKELYNWWKNVRPSRRDPYDESGWTEASKADPINFDDFEFGKTTPEKKLALEKMRQLELKYEREDEEMLIRLIKIRRSLWT